MSSLRRAALQLATQLATRSLKLLNSTAASGVVTHLRTAFMEPITTGLPLNVPTTNDTRIGRSASLRSISHDGPTTAPVAWPPPSDLPSTTTSASTPYNSCAPPGPNWKAHVSSKSSGIRLAVHTSRSFPSHTRKRSIEAVPASTLLCPTAAVLALPQPKPLIGFTMTPAISLERSRSRAKDSSHWSLRTIKSELKRSFPAPCITPSHQPW
mmetsp:Transcript_55878/g.157452  ORF Transcript_55878/g.157452 Transcript_55878/m.157452 type:complete len:211 (-) Transcript_55878:745-1377(-)